MGIMMGDYCGMHGATSKAMTSKVLKTKKDNKVKTLITINVEWRKSKMFSSLMKMVSFYIFFLLIIIC